MKPFAILIAEDDQLVRTILARMAKEFSDDVTVCADGREALDALEARGYDLVLTDLKMPRASGMALLERARSKNQSTSAIVVSGFAEPQQQKEIAQLGGRLLHKPFTASMLRSVIRQELNDRGPTI